MKKIFTFTLILFLIFPIFSCKKNAPQCYQALIDQNVLSLSKYSFPKDEQFSSALQTYQRDAAKKQRTVTILNQQMDLQYQYSIADSIWDYGITDIYHDDSGNYEIGFETETDRINKMIAKNGHSILSYPSDTLSEAFFSDWLKSSVLDLLSLDVSSYDIVYKTVIANKNGTALDTRIENSFIADHNEEIVNYSIEFQKKTENECVIDFVRILSLPNGDILSIAYFPSGIEKADEIKIDFEKLNKTIEATLEKIYGKKEIADFQIESRHIRKNEKGYYLVCGIYAELNYESESLSNRFLLAVFLES